MRAHQYIHIIFGFQFFYYLINLYLILNLKIFLAIFFFQNIIMHHQDIVFFCLDYFLVTEVKVNMIPSIHYYYYIFN
jgi:hypothetical protein